MSAQTDKLTTLFADVGREAADNEVLDEAFVALARQVPSEDIAAAACQALPDMFGWCSDCGASLRNGGHKRGGDGCITGLVIPFVAAAWVRAAWRRALVRLHSPATGFPKAPGGGEAGGRSHDSYSAQSAPGNNPEGEV